MAVVKLRVSILINQIRDFLIDLRISFESVKTIEKTATNNIKPIFTDMFDFDDYNF